MGHHISLLNEGSSHVSLSCYNNRSPVIIIKEEHCMHTIVMKEMCCECGADLRK